MPGEQAINNITDAALSGNPIAIILACAAIYWMLDKTWWHTKGRKDREKQTLCDPEVIDSLQKTTEIQAKILSEIKEGRDDSQQAHAELLQLNRDQKTSDALVLHELQRKSS